MKSSGFDCRIVPSFDRAFPDKWAHSTVEMSPGLAHTDTVYAGLPWEIYIFFQGYSRTDSGTCDVLFSYKIVGPKGTVILDTSGIRAITGPIAPDAGMLPSRFIPAVCFSQKDTTGRYKIIVTAEDKVAKVKKTGEHVVILSKFPKIASYRFDDISFNIWIHRYCIEPDPGRAVAAFSFFIESRLSNDDAVFWPVFYFFQCLFSDNPSLVETLALNFPRFSQRIQEYVVFLLRTIRYNKTGIAGAIPDSLWKKFDKASETGFCDPLTYAFKIKSNRFIEFGFYYYGRYRLIRFLIECLGLNSPSGYEAFLKNCTDYGDGCRQCLDSETALQFYSVARKILEKTYSKNLLVHAYCDYALENDRVEASAKKALSEIIASSRR